MSGNGNDNNNDEHGSPEKPSGNDQAENGHSGEGAASAMAHMISQGQQHRHQTGEPEDAAGSRHQ